MRLAAVPVALATIPLGIEVNASAQIAVLAAIVAATLIVEWHRVGPARARPGASGEDQQS